MNREVRKGLVNHEVNRDLFGFLTVECLMLSGLLTYFGTTWFHFNLVATLALSLIGVFILALTPMYHILGVFLSIGWGYLLFKLLFWLVAVTSGAVWLCWTLGIVGFVFGFLVTLAARIGGKEYIDDIE